MAVALRDCSARRPSSAPIIDRLRAPLSRAGLVLQRALGRGNSRVVPVSGSTTLSPDRCSAPYASSVRLLTMYGKPVLYARFSERAKRRIHNGRHVGTDDCTSTCKERSPSTSPMRDGPRSPTSKSSGSMWPSGDGRRSPSRCIRTPRERSAWARATADPSLTSSIPFVVTSPDYDRDTITLYF